MKLYQTDFSPFGARCRMQIYAKRLTGIEFAPADQGRALNPVARTPVLEVDGVVLGESTIICEFLEERFPEPSLWPTEHLEKAFARLLMRIVDLYLIPHLASVTKLRRNLDCPANELSEATSKLLEGCDFLEATLEVARHSGRRYALGNQLTLADCALGPALLFWNRLRNDSGNPPVPKSPMLEGYWTGILHDEHFATIESEMSAALWARLRT